MQIRVATQTLNVGVRARIHFSTGTWLGQMLLHAPTRMMSLLPAAHAFPPLEGGPDQEACEGHSESKEGEDLWEEENEKGKGGKLKEDGGTQEEGEGGGRHCRAHVRAASAHQKPCRSATLM